MTCVDFIYPFKNYLIKKNQLILIFDVTIHIRGNDLYYIKTKPKPTPMSKICIKTVQMGSLILGNIVLSHWTKMHTLRMTKLGKEGIIQNMVEETDGGVHKKSKAQKYISH